MRGLIKVNDARAMRTTLRLYLFLLFSLVLPPIAKLCYFLMLVLLLSSRLLCHAALKIFITRISIRATTTKFSTRVLNNNA